MAFTTSVVGSFPRPKWLIEAFDKFNRGELRKEELQALLDDAVKLTIKEEELAGLDVITDGEQRRTSFVSFLGQKLPGFKLVHITQLNPSAMEIMKQHKAQLTYWRAVATDSVCKAGMAVDELDFVRRCTNRPVKVTLPSPYLVMWETWHAQMSKAHYPQPEDLARDYVKVLREEILRLRDTGAAFIQLDEPMLGDLVEASETEPDRYRKVTELIHGQKYRGFKAELQLARELINQVIEGIDGVRIGMHMDHWPPRHSPYYGTGYEKLLPDVLDIKVRQYVLEYASAGSGDPTKFVEHLAGDREIGLGVIDIRKPEVEDPAEVVSRVERIVKHMDPERIWLNPDCGFAPGMYRSFARRPAFDKVKAMVVAATRLREKYARR